MGFKKAAQTLTRQLSPEATREFTSLVQTVAGQYSYDDSAMLNAVRRRLNSAARQRQAWAVEVMGALSGDGKPQKATA